MLFIFITKTFQKTKTTLRINIVYFPVWIFTLLMKSYSVFAIVINSVGLCFLSYLDLCNHILNRNLHSTQSQKKQFSFYEPQVSKFKEIKIFNNDSQLRALCNTDLFFTKYPCKPVQYVVKRFLLDFYAGSHTKNSILLNQSIKKQENNYFFYS